MKNSTQYFTGTVKLMIYVGIDIEKETHVAAAVDPDGVTIIEPSFIYY